MKDHHFFNKDKWIGEGKISVEGEEEVYSMLMKFIIKDLDEKNPVYEFSTQIHIEGSDDVIENNYTLTMHKKKSFHILIFGESWGHVEGSGFVKDDFIGWEVASMDGSFHAYESLDISRDGEIIFFGEYSTLNEMRTKMEGTLTSYENISH